MLYIISTPIGNLKDISYRAIECLKSCDQIFCEDKRKAKILLDAYQIKKPLISFHAFSEKKEEAGLLQAIRQGKTLALISDAGTPLINDPGEALLQKLIQEGLPFTHIPGPCSIISALVLSGLPTERFQFVGFLPKKRQAKKKELQKMLYFQGTSLAFESPYRIEKTLEDLQEIAPWAQIVILRELTKVYEETLRGTPIELLHHFAKKPPKGEMILLTAKELTTISLPLEEMIPLLQEELGLSFKESLKLSKKFSS